MRDRGGATGRSSRLGRGRIGAARRADFMLRLIWAAAAATVLAALWATLRFAQPDDATRQAAGSSPTSLPASHSGAAEGLPSSGGDNLLLEPPYDSFDGLTIVQGAYRIRLAGLEGPLRDAICVSGDGRLWACGLQARAALHNLIAQKPLICRSLQPLSPGVIVAADCTAEGEDIAHALVETGWAKPTDASGKLAPERDLARRERRGLWDGDWTIRGGSLP